MYDFIFITREVLLTLVTYDCGYKSKEITLSLNLQIFLIYYTRFNGGVRYLSSVCSLSRERSGTNRMTTVTTVLVGGQYKICRGFSTEPPGGWVFIFASLKRDQEIIQLLEIGVYWL